MDDPAVENPFEELPGGEMIARGLADLARGERSESGLLVLVASRRLRQLGLAVPAADGLGRPSTHALYDLLEETSGAAAYSRYNALLRTLSSFIHALESDRARNAPTR